jgi:DNA-binding MarR family transcriptional regulator
MLLSMGMERCEDSVADCAVHNLRRATRVVTRLFDEALLPCGLRATQLNVLIVVWRAEGATMGRMARLLAMDRTTLGRNLHVLEQRGLVAIGSDRDRRERLISLTPEGRTALEAALPLWEKVQASVVTALGAARWDGLLAGMAAMARLRGAAGNRG